MPNHKFTISLNGLKSNWINLFITLTGILFFFFLGETAVSYQNDSLGYLTLGFAREPFYPLFIQFFYLLLGEAYYLTFVTFFQGILALLCILYAILFLQQNYRLNPLESYLCFLLLLIPYGIDTLWKEPRIVYTHFIVTESITYSLFYLFVILLIKAVLTKKLRFFMAASLLALLLSLTRGQMMICFPALFVGLFFFFFQEVKKFLAGCVLLFLLFACIGQVTNLYHYVLHGIYASPMENSLTVFTNLLFASDQEDIALIEDKEEAAFLQKVYEEADRLGYRYTYSQGGLIQTGNLLMASHDKIKYDILRGALYEYTDNLGMPRDYAAEQAKKELLDSISAVLRKDNMGTWIFNCISLLPMALLLSFHPITPPSLLPFLYASAILITLFSIAALIFRLVRERRIENGTLFLGAVMTLLLTNVGGLCISIYGISRYTNYTMGLYYIGLYLFIKEWIVRRKANPILPS